MVFYLIVERILCPLGDEVPFHLRKGRHNVEEELPHGGLRVDPVGDAVERYMMLCKELYEVEGINDLPGLSGLRQHYCVLL